MGLSHSDPLEEQPNGNRTADAVTGKKQDHSLTRVEPRRNNRQNREGGEVKWEDHLIVNPDFFANATNKLGNT